MSKPIPMTMERFFKLLSATKKLHPRLVGNQIRFNQGGCPLSAVRQTLSGKGIRKTGSFDLENAFDFRHDARRPAEETAVRLLMKAADDSHPDYAKGFTIRLRRRMLRTLGLRGKKS
jgi:hypothetical protein